MKKILKGLIISSLFISQATASTKKTFLLPRPQGANLAMEYTTWNELLLSKDPNRFGTNLQVIGFYQDSENGTAVGRYFGVESKNRFKIAGADFIKRNINYEYMFHDQDNTRFGTGDKVDMDITYKPKLEAHGSKIYLYQDLGKLLKGLYFRANIPIVHVKTDVNLSTSVLGNTASHSHLTTTDLKAYFKGDSSNTKMFPSTGKNATHALDKLKIDGPKNQTDLADIDIAFGYKFWDKENFHVTLDVNGTIPTGTTPKGRYLFEPVVGNANHWAAGARLDSHLDLFSNNDKNQKIKATLALDYKYLFKGGETRTVGIKTIGELDDTVTATTLCDYNFSHYWLLAKKSNITGQQKLYPAANVLTRKVDVTPGNMIDGILALSFVNGGFSFDLGYNFFWKDSEYITVKSWDDYEYGLIRAHKVVSNTKIENTDCVGTEFLTMSNLDTGVASSSSQVTHKLYCGLGFVATKCSYPPMIGIGAHYEWADNDGIENWSIWGKVGIAF